MLNLLLAALLVQFAPTSRIWLEGDSTLHRYHADATRWTIHADQDLRDLAVEIPVRGLKSGEAGLDDNLYRALKAEAFPTISFAATRCKVQGKRIEAEGRLTVAGKARPITVRATGDASHVTGAVELRMSQFGVQPPVLMGGVIKCADAIVVKFDLKGS